MAAELEFVLENPDSGRVLAFPSKTFLIGSGERCQVRFAPELVQPEHAEILKDERGQWWVRDVLNSGSVAINGAAIADERLSAGDVLRVGGVVLAVRDTGIAAGARTRSGDSLAAVSEELQPETVIDGRYRILKRLVTGGMGQVYRAVHVELHKPLALKVMLPALSDDKEFVARFKREAIASARIGQQNIVDISDFGRMPDGRFYFVMEFVDGKTLVKVRRDGPLPFDRVVHIGAQIAQALSAAHAVGIVHRDLKPDNVMLVQKPGQPDFVKVLDFGIAKITGGQTAVFTAVGAVVGTPQYMPPEQARGEPVDARSDVYSLGLILHELITGKPAFEGDSAPELMGKQVHAAPPPLTSVHGEVPRALERLVFQMLEKQVAKRPQSMGAVIKALETVDSTPMPAELAAVRPNRAPIIVLAVMAMVTLGVALLALNGRTTPLTPPEPVVKPTPLPVPPTVVPEQPVKLTLQSEPPQAEVYEGDVLLGTTPLALTRTPGTVAEFRFELRDFAPVSRKVRFEADSSISVPLERVKPVKKGAARRTGNDDELKDAPF